MVVTRLGTGKGNVTSFESSLEIKRDLKLGKFCDNTSKRDIPPFIGKIKHYLNNE